jgi:hypothetical protein
MKKDGLLIKISEKSLKKEEKAENMKLTFHLPLREET